jgi:hypothetical protein
VSDAEERAFFRNVVASGRAAEVALRLLGFDEIKPSAEARTTVHLTFVSGVPGETPAWHEVGRRTDVDYQRTFVPDFAGPQFFSLETQRPAAIEVDTEQRIVRAYGQALGPEVVGVATGPAPERRSCRTEGCEGVPDDGLRLCDSCLDSYDYRDE